MKTLKERFFNKIEIIPFHCCWEWLGSKYNGYGKMMVSKKPRWAHRLSYELHKGKIPTGLHIDHLCSNRGCVNPEHLEAVSQEENNKRAWEKNRKKYCKRGHEFSKENTYSYKYGRMCRTCAIDKSKRRFNNHHGTGGPEVPPPGTTPE